MALQIAPLIVLERRILILLYLFMAGIILFHLMATIWHDGDYLNWLLCGSLLAMIAGLGAAINARHSAGHDRVFSDRSNALSMLWWETNCNISQKPGYNYLIYIDKDKLKIINNFGSSQQVCPALQPRPC